MMKKPASRPRHIIADGYSCSAGLTKTGWFAAALVIPDRDREFTEDILEPGFDRNVRLLPQKSMEGWTSASVNSGRRIVLVVEKDGELSEQLIGEACRMYGPATPKEIVDAPTVAWTEKTAGRWRLKLSQNRTTSSIYSSEQILASPSVAVFGNEARIAVQTESNGKASIVVFGESGDCLFECEGRNPVVTAAGGQLFLLSEQLSTTGIDLVLDRIGSGKDENRLTLSGDDLNINGDMVYEPETDTLFICWESSPGWGMDPFAGKHRDINVGQLSSLRSGALQYSPAPGTVDGKLWLPREAYADGQEMNMTPTYPRLAFRDKSPILAFRRFRYRAARSFGWDVYCMSLADHIWSPLPTWSPPHRISDFVGPPDARYEIRADVGAPATVAGTATVVAPAIENRMLSCLPCCDNRPDSTRTYKHRIEIRLIPSDFALPAPEMPVRERSPYVVPYPVPDVAPSPADQNSAGNGYQLVWADLHNHTFQSKCMCSIDGSPDDVLHFTRDVLGCRVLTLMDHPQHMGAQEFTWHLDRLEAGATGNNIILYGCEPGLSSGHDTNFYTLDREIFERLRLIFLTTFDRADVYSEIKRFFPAGSVFALRHYHGNPKGPHGILSPQCTETWDSNLEFAMEAMQVRGNVFLGQADGETPLFPANFLNSGARIGLVGGSDHSSGKLRNHFCLTGFWVNDLTQEGVWDAIRTGRTLACSNGKIALWPEIEGGHMGSEVTVTGKVEINVAVSAARTVRRLCLIRDGEQLAWIDFDAKQGEILLTDDFAGSGRHWYVVTAEGSSAFQEGDCLGKRREGTPVIAHASPIYINIHNGEK